MDDDAHAFRIRALVPHRHNLTDPAGNVEAQTEYQTEAAGIPLELSLGPRLIPDNAAHVSTVANALAGKHLIVSGSGLSSEQDALTVADQVTDALRALSVVTSIAIDVGDDKPERPMSVSFVKPKDDEPVREAPDALRLRLQAFFDVHGGIVFPSSPDLVTEIFTAQSGDEGLSFPTSGFYQAFEHCLRSIQPLDPTTRLAIDLHSQSQFEASDRARFLTLVTCLEVLAVTRRRSAATVEHIDRLIAQTRAELEGKVGQRELDSLVDGLGLLKTVSLSSAIQALAQQYEIPNKPDAAAFLRRAYRARSRLVHDGTWPFKDEPLRPFRQDLWIVTGDLLRSRLRENGIESSATWRDGDQDS